MGTPHVHCMSKLPTAHEPGERGAAAPGDRHTPDTAVPREEPVTTRDVFHHPYAYVAGRRAPATPSGPAADIAVGVRAAV
jgi:hypothetical protein